MNLVEYLPNRLQGTAIGLYQEALQPEISQLWENQTFFVAQLWPSTATWGLSHWENALGITVDVSKSDEYRRTAIVAALRGAGTSTVAALQSVAESFSNGSVDVVEYPGEYRVEIRFTSIVGVPPNMEDLTVAVTDMMPAHLEWAFVYQYRTNGMLRGYTHAELRAFTNETLKSGELGGT